MNDPAKTAGERNLQKKKKIQVKSFSRPDGVQPTGASQVFQGKVRRRRQRRVFVVESLVKIHTYPEPATSGIRSRKKELVGRGQAADCGHRECEAVEYKGDKHENSRRLRMVADKKREIKLLNKYFILM